MRGGYGYGGNNLQVNWGFNGQEEQTMSVGDGMGKIANSIDEMVKRKYETDREFDVNQREILKNTSAKYQQELLGKIDKYKEDIKSVGKVNWHNKDLRLKREEILRDLTAASGKANYITQALPKIEEGIKADKYIKKDEAYAALREELGKSFDDVDVQKLEQIVTSPLYRDVNSILRDAHNNFVGTDKSTYSYSYKDGKFDNTDEYEYNKNWRIATDKDGKPIVEGNRIKFESNIGQEEVKRIFDSTGNPKMMFDYFSKILQSNPNNTLTPSHGEEFEKAVYNLAKDYINTTVGAYSMKTARRAQIQVPTASAADVTKQQELKDQKMTIDSFYESLNKDGGQDIIRAIPDNRGAVSARWKKDGYFYNPRTNELKHLSEFSEDEQVKTKLGYKPKGSGWKNFTGIAYKVPVKTSSSKSSDEGFNFKIGADGKPITGADGKPIMDDSSKEPNYIWRVSEISNWNDANALRNVATSAYNDIYTKKAGYEPDRDVLLYKGQEFDQSSFKDYIKTYKLVGANGKPLTDAEITKLYRQLQSKK